MEWQTRLPMSGHKRPSDAALHEFRARQSQSPAQLDIGHAESSGSSRMLNGNVRGDIYHGNVNITNHFNAHQMPGDPDPHEPDTHQNFSSVLSNSEKQELFKKLYFPQLDGRLMNLRTARKRTCEWLLRRRDYQEWMDMGLNHTHANSGLFWIRGNPGTGKSVTMKFLFQRMQSRLNKQEETTRNELVLSFFFNARGSDLEKSTLGLYRSLLFGLLSSDPNLLKVLDHCTRGQCLSILSGEWEQKPERLLQELYENALDLLAKRKKRLYCYVDALDECPEYQIRDMVTYFEDIMTGEKSSNLRVCFSSRHYPRISIRTKLTITLEHEANHNDDIQTYIRSELRFDEHTDQIEVDQLRDAILQRSAGIFLWVSLVVSQLNEVFNNDGRMDAIWERLEEIPRAAKETPIFNGDLPLYGLFQDVIMKDRKNLPDLVRLTQLIFSARRPLSPREVFVALHRTYHEPFDTEKVNPHILSKNVLATSKGLAEVTIAEEVKADILLEQTLGISEGLAEVTISDNSTVQFIHETVRDFLRDGGLSMISKQSLHGDGNEVMKISCLDQIKALDAVADRFELLADYRTWTSFPNEKDGNISASPRHELQEQVSQKFPFLKYATQHVLFHANAASAQGVPQRSFLNSFPRRLWVLLHNFFQGANTKRFGGSDTSILYILASHRLNDLIRTSVDQQNYATVCKNEKFPTALHNAIYNGNFDTAWVLVGLDLRDRPPRLDEPKLSLSGVRKTLLREIIDADEVEILRKVIRDLGVTYLQRDAAWAQEENGRDLILRECRSVAMIDCLAQHSMLPSMRPAGDNAQNGSDGDESVSPISDLFFIRQAIGKQPELLTDTVWNGQCMLQFAVKRRFLSLFALIFELMNSRDPPSPTECVEIAAMDGWLAALKKARSHGADLDHQDESGRTILHKMLAGDSFRNADPQKQRDLCSILQYLLFESPKLGASVDKRGYTAFDLIRNDLWGRKNLDPENDGYKKALEVFVKTGAMTKTGFIRNDHEYPWVVVPWISIQFSKQLSGEKELTKLDARDNLGRTALSWCFWSRTGVMPDEIYLYYAARNKGLGLLKSAEVDVNSRDNSGYTILEHLIRHPKPHEYPLGELTIAFFKSSDLDVNLETSDRRSPLDLIISLYGTWLLESVDTDAGFKALNKTLKGARKKLWLSEGLRKTAQLLLATGKVDVSEQKRCLAKSPNDLRALILESIREVEPDYRDGMVDNQNELDYHDWTSDDMIQ